MPRNKRHYEDEKGISLEFAEKRRKTSEENEEGNQEELTITILPPEILIYIFQFLSRRDVVSTDLVGGQFHSVSRADYLWKMLLSQYYGETITRNSNHYRQSFIDKFSDDVKLSSQLPARTETEAIVFSYLKNNDLESLKEVFPDYLSLKYFLYDDSKVRIQQTVMHLFGRLSNKLLVRPTYQRGLDYLHDLVAAEFESKPPQQVDQQAAYLLSSPVMRAVLFNQPCHTLRDLVDSGFDINENFSTDPNEHWRSPICLAVMMGNLEQVKNLLAFGADANMQAVSPEWEYKYFGPRDLLWLAAHYCHHHLVDYLKEELKKDNTEIEAIYRMAYLKRDIIALTCFVECGIEIDFTSFKEGFREGTYDSDSVLWTEFVRNLIEANCVLLIEKIKKLLSHQLNFSQFICSDYFGHQGRQCAKGFNEDFYDNCFYNLLNLTAHYNRRELLRDFLVMFKDEIDIKETCKQAYIRADTTALACFLECGIEIDFKSLRKEANDTPFWQYLIFNAVKNNQLLLVKKLLAVSIAGVAIKWSDTTLTETNKRVYWLHEAAMRGYGEIVSLLLQSEAYIDRLYPAGSYIDRRYTLHLRSDEIPLRSDETPQAAATPLMCASMKGHLAVVKILVEAGANIEKQCNRLPSDINTPLKIARAKGHTAVADYLSAELNRRNHYHQNNQVTNLLPSFSNNAAFFLPKPKPRPLAIASKGSFHFGSSGGE